MTEPLKPGPLPEPLFLLHTGDLFGNERDEWEVEANSGRAVDEFAEAQAIGAEIGLHPDQAMHAYAAQEVAAAVAVERERWTEAVMAELDGNGQALASVAYAIRAKDAP